MVITLYNKYYSQRKTSRLELLRRSRMKIYNIVTRPRDLYNNNNNNISIIFALLYLILFTGIENIYNYYLLLLLIFVLYVHVPIYYYICDSDNGKGHSTYYLLLYILYHIMDLNARVAIYS